jgi:hypothetical protein
MTMFISLVLRVPKRRGIMPSLRKSRYIVAPSSSVQEPNTMIAMHERYRQAKAQRALFPLSPPHFHPITSYSFNLCSPSTSIP